MTSLSSAVYDCTSVRLEGAGACSAATSCSGGMTRALGMVLNHPGPMAVLGYERCKRFAMYVVDGVIKIVRVAESPDDPAGDDFPDVTLAPAMLEAIQALGKDEL